GVMCGSGVTACHLVLAACLAGHPEPRLYVGSWSEWIRDTGRPIDKRAAEP
ncbi:MAG: sulfurtransferase, partial [Gammaproteobacteria bacterium]